MNKHNFKHQSENFDSIEDNNKSISDLPFWYGHEDSDQIRSIISSFEDVILQRHSPTTRRPKQFIGRVSRYFLCFSLPLRTSFITIDEVNVFPLLLLPKGMSLPKKSTVFCRTSWDLEDGLPTQIEILDDQNIQKELLGPCSHLYKEPKWNTNYYLDTPSNDCIQFEYHVDAKEVQVGYAGHRTFSSCLRNGFENLAKSAATSEGQVASQPKNISKPKLEIKWKIDDEDEEEDDIFNDHDEVEDFNGELYLLKDQRAQWDDKITSFSELINEDEEEGTCSDELEDDEEDFFDGDDLLNSSDDESEDESSEEEEELVRSSSSEEEEEEDVFFDDEDEEEILFSGEVKNLRDFGILKKDVNTEPHGSIDHFFSDPCNIIKSV